MKKSKCWMIGLVLALAGVLLLAGSGLAQNQGSGNPGGPGSQLCTGGPGGTCVVNPAPPNSSNQNCPGYGAGKAQKQKGMKGPRSGCQGNQPNTPANPPASSQ